MNAADLVAIVPELILLTAACAVVLVEAFVHPQGAEASGGTDRAGGRWGLFIAVFGLLASSATALGLLGQERVAFGGMLTLDEWAVFFKVLFGAGACLVVLMSPAYLRAHQRHLGEYYALLLFAVVGMDLMAAARDFVLFYVGLELMAISSYLLAAFFRYRLKSGESSLKYFVTGSVASAITLYGISLVYGLTGSTGYEAVGAALGSGTGAVFAVFLVTIGLAFKVSAAPFHMWTPDVYQGAPTPVAAFFSVGPKAAGFAVFLAAYQTAFGGVSREWGMLLIVLSVLTMLVGTLYALVQTNVKRMLAYSSIAHAGYLLAGLGVVGWTGEARAAYGVLAYLVAYTVMNVGAFGVLAFLKAESSEKFDYSLGHLAGLGRRSPWPALMLSLLLLSLTGIPGTAGFIGKFYLFGGMVWAGTWWLAVVGVLFSAVSAYYYLRVIVHMFFKEPEEAVAGKVALRGGMAISLTVATLATVAIGLLPSWLLEVAEAAYQALF